MPHMGIYILGYPASGSLAHLSETMRRSERIAGVAGLLLCWLVW
jgi:hypothetical protein